MMASFRLKEESNVCRGSSCSGICWVISCLAPVRVLKQLALDFSRIRVDVCVLKSSPMRTFFQFEVEKTVKNGGGGCVHKTHKMVHKPKRPSHGKDFLKYRAEKNLPRSPQNQKKKKNSENQHPPPKTTFFTGCRAPRESQEISKKWSVLHHQQLQPYSGYHPAVE